MRLRLAAFLDGLPLGQWVRACFGALGAALLAAAISAGAAPELRALRQSSEQLRRDYQALQAKMRGIGRARGRLDKGLSGEALETLKKRLWQARELGRAEQALAIEAEISLREAQSSTGREAVLEENRRRLDIHLKPLENLDAALSRLALGFLAAAGVFLLGGLRLLFLGRIAAPTPNPDLIGIRRGADKTARILASSAWSWAPLAGGAYLAWAQSRSIGEEAAAAAVWIAGMGLATALGGFFMPQAVASAFSGRDWAGSRWLSASRRVYPKLGPLDWVGRASLLAWAEAAVLIARGLGWVDPLPGSLAIATLSLALLARTVRSSATENKSSAQEPWLRLARWTFAFLALAGLSHALSSILPRPLWQWTTLAFFALSCGTARRCSSACRASRDTALTPGALPIAMKHLLVSILLASPLLSGEWWSVFLDPEFDENAGGSLRLAQRYVSLLAVVPWLLAARAMWAPGRIPGRLVAWLRGQKPPAPAVPDAPAAAQEGKLSAAELTDFRALVATNNAFQAACLMAWLAALLPALAGFGWITPSTAAIGVAIGSLASLAIAWRSPHAEPETWPLFARRAFLGLALAGLCYSGLVALRHYATIPMEQKLEEVKERLAKAKAIAGRLPRLEAELVELNKSYAAAWEGAAEPVRLDIVELQRKWNAKLSARLSSDPKSKEVLRLHHKLRYTNEELARAKVFLAALPDLTKQQEAVSLDLSRLRWWSRLGAGLCASLFAWACLAALRCAAAHRLGRGPILYHVKVPAALGNLLGSALLGALAPPPWSMAMILPWLLAFKALFGIELPWGRMLPLFGGPLPDFSASSFKLGSATSLRLLSAGACLIAWVICAGEIHRPTDWETAIFLALGSWLALAGAWLSNEAGLRKEPWFHRAIRANACLSACAALLFFKEESLTALAAVFWYLAAAAMWDVPFLRRLGGFFWRQMQRLEVKMGQRHPLIGELALLTRYLSAAANRGLPLAGAVHAFAQTSRRPPQRDALDRLEKALQGGSELSRAFESLQDEPRRRPLPHAYLAMLKAGEASGDLPAALRMALQALLEEEELSHRLSTVLTYFAAVAAILGTVFVFLLTFVVPPFKAIFDSFDFSAAEMGWPSRLVFWLSNHSDAQYPAFLVMAQFFLLMKTYEKGEFRRLLPGMDKVLEKIAETRACHSLAWLLASGCPADQALDLAGGGVPDAAAGPVLKKAAERVRRGESLSASVGGPGGLSREFQWACALGEHRGDLPDTLRWLGGYLRLSAKYHIDLMIPLVERSATVALGLLVGIILVALFTPMFWLGSLTGGYP